MGSSESYISWLGSNLSSRRMWFHYLLLVLTCSECYLVEAYARTGFLSRLQSCDPPHHHHCNAIQCA